MWSLPGRGQATFLSACVSVTEQCPPVLPPACESLPCAHAGSLGVPLGAVLAVCWAITKQSWVFLCVAFMSPILVSQIRPIAGARPQYGVSQLQGSGFGLHARGRCSI